MLQLKVLLISSLLLGVSYSLTCTSPEILDTDNTVCLSSSSACTGSRFYNPQALTCSNTCDLGNTYSVASSQNQCNPSPYSCDPSQSLLVIGGNNFQCLSNVTATSTLSQCTGFLVKDSNGLYICLPICPTGFTAGTGTSSNICTSTSTISWVNHAFVTCSSGVRDVQTLSCYTSRSSCTNYYSEDNRACLTFCPVGFSIQQGSGFQYCLSGNQQYNIFYSIPTCTSPQVYDLTSNSCLSSGSSCNFYLLTDSSGTTVCWPSCPTAVGFQLVNTTSTSGTTTTTTTTCSVPSGFAIASQSFFSCNYPNIRDATTLGCISQDSQCKGVMNYESNLCAFSCPQGQLLQQFNGQKNIAFCWRYQLNSCGSGYYFDLMTYRCQNSGCQNILLTDSTSNQFCWPFCPTALGFTMTTNSAGGQICAAPSGFTILSQPFFNCGAPGIKDAATLGCLANAAACKFRLITDLGMCVTQCPNDFIEQTAGSSNTKICSFTRNKYFNLPQCGGGLYIDINTYSCLQNDSDCKNVLIKDANGGRACWPSCPSGYTASTSTSGQSLCTPPAGTIIANQPFFSCIPPSVKDVATLGCLSQISSCTNKMIWDQGICALNCPSNYQEFDNNPNPPTKSCNNNYSTEFSGCKSPQYLNVNTNQCIQNDTDCTDNLIKDQYGGRLCSPVCISGYTQTSPSGVNYKLCTPPSGTSIFQNTFFECQNPQVRDVTNLGCLSSQSACKNVIMYNWWTCFATCPPNTVQGTDAGNGLQTCNYNNNNGGNGGNGGNGNNTYKMTTCVAPNYLYFMENNCISADTSCLDYVITDSTGFKLCWPVCPSGYTAGKDATNGFLTCTPPASVSLASLPIFNCPSPSVQDVYTLSCLSSMNNCNQIIVSDRNQCVTICPNGYIYGTDQNNKANCWNNNVSNCQTGQVWNLAQNQCMPPASCKDWVLTDSNGYMTCIPQCPTIFTTGMDTTNTYKTCSAPSGKTVNNYPIANCNNPLIRDFSGAGCFTAASQCTGYLVNNFSCVTTCPSGYQTGTDQNNNKQCYMPYVYSMATCSSGNYLNFQRNSCISSDSNCSDYVIQDSSGAKVCWPSCSISGFTQTTTSGIKYCTPPSGWLLSAQPFFNCPSPSVASIDTFQCLGGISACAPNLYIQDRNMCSALCLNNYVYGTDNNGNKVCYNRGSPNCSSNQIQNYLQNNCIPVNGCRDYVLVGQSICIPDCPWTIGQDTVNNVKTCTLPAGQALNNYPISNCNQPQLRDFSTGNCLASQSACTKWLVNDYNCVSACPNGYNQSKNQNGQNACNQPYQYQMQNCPYPQFLQFNRNYCISNDTDCNQYVMMDTAGNKVCWPLCPPQYTASTNASTGVKYCQPPSGTLLTSAPIFNNCNYPQVWDITTLSCLSSQSACTKIYVNGRNQCTNVCFDNYSYSTNSTSQFCNYQGNNNCQSTQIQNILINQCINPSDCQDYLFIQGTSQNQQNACIPDCPSIFTKGTNSAGQKTCTPPATANINSYAISQCGQPQIRDFTSAGCLAPGAKCSGYLVNQYNCVSACPSAFSASTDSNGNKICVQNSNGCPTNQLRRILNQDCVNLSDCREYVFNNGAQGMYCLPQCPQPFNQSFDPVNNVFTCTLPSGTTLNSYPLGSCSTLRDMFQAGCLTAASQCKGIAVLSQSVCLTNCPQDFHQTTDSSGNQTCQLGTPFQFGNCGSSTVLDISVNQCIAATSCTGQLITDAAGIQYCLPFCPSAWKGTNSAGAAVCNVPSTFTYSTSAFATCASPGVYNTDDMTCLASASACTGFLLKQNRLCMPSCPSTLSIFIDPKTGSKQCMQMDSQGSMQCPFPYIQNWMDGSCIYADQCKYTLLEADQGLFCIPQCPSAMIPGTDSNLNLPNCKTPAGVILNSFAIAQCKPPNYRDFTSGGCLTSPASCKGFILESRKSCITTCPSGWQQVANSAGYTNCVAPVICQPTYIPDTANKVCLSSVQLCKGVFNTVTSTCDASCPTNYASQLSATLNVNVCVPCFYKDTAGNCYQTCPYPLISVAPTSTNQAGSCLSDPTQCTGYFTSTLNTCEASCRFGFTAVNTTSPKSCLPCASAGSCSATSTNSCTQKLSADSSSCSASCPIAQIALPQVAGQSYQQCQLCSPTNPFVSFDGTTCVSKCGPNYALNTSTQQCSDPSTCQGVLYTDPSNNEYCMAYCPSGLTGVKNSAGLYVCQLCAGGTYFDPVKQSCQASCSLKDATGTYCIISIGDCIGCISSDGTQCLSSCPTGQYKMPSTVLGQYNCKTSCAPPLLIYNGLCLSSCPVGMYVDSVNNTCSSTKPGCSGVLSIDGLLCLSSCPAGQYPASNGSAKQCAVCALKLSSDGKSCNQSCATGELYDLDLLQCVASSGCSAKILQSDGISCASSCLLGQILSVSGTTKSCLSSISSCKQVISSDLKSCGTSCNTGEAQIANGTLTMCVVCPMGVGSDGKSCRTSCASGTYYEVSSQTCVASCAAGELISANGLNCVSSCVYPDLKRSSDNTKCYSTCDSTNVIDNVLGCIAPASCITNGKYVTYDALQCIVDCAIFQHAIDSSNAGYCKPCSSNSFPRLVSGKIVCQIKSDNTANDLTQQAVAFASQFTAMTTITPDLKGQIKSQIQSISAGIESALISTLSSNSQLTQDQKKQQTLSLIQSIQNLGSGFISKIDTTSSSSESSSANTLVLGTSEFQFVTQKKQAGFVFSVSFSLTDFYSSSPPLQQNASKLNLATQGAQIDGSIQSMAVTNLATNPYCTDTTSCGSAGLFQISATRSSSKRRFLQTSSSSSTSGSYTLTYNVQASQLSKTVCVNYSSSGTMNVSLNTSRDTTNNQVTCTFNTPNNSIYYDSKCAIVSSSNCASTSTTTTTTGTGTGSGTNPTTTTTVSPKSGRKLLFSIMMLLALFLI